ncbi:MAG: retropepsin-like aspartic protease [Planctomycetota bacterium]
MRLGFGSGQPEVWAKIDGGRSYRFMIDTGAESSLLINAPFARRHGLVAEPDRLSEVKIHGFEGTSRSYVGAFARFSFGDLTANHCPTELLAQPNRLGQAGNARLAGIIGTGMLYELRVAFDLKAGACSSNDRFS